MEVSDNVIEIDAIDAGYDGGRVLQSCSLTVRRGEMLGLVGRNGVGKTTLVRALFGTIPTDAGEIRVLGRPVSSMRPRDRIELGLALVPQGRRVFGELSVETNLRLARSRSAESWTIEQVYDLLPRLEERRKNRASSLSGGEQQMLAIGRALLQHPDVLVLDEPSEGLAPVIIREVADVLAKMVGTGLSILLVEQNIGVVERLADRVAVMVKGSIVHTSDRDEFSQDEGLKHRLLALG